MSLEKLCTIVSLVSLLGLAGSVEFYSPCPNLFHYDSTDQPNQWTATLTLLSDSELHGVWIRLIFDEKLTEVKVHNDFGEVISSDNTQFLIKNRNYSLKKGTPTPVTITVKYDGPNVPTLLGFRLNAKEVCPPQDDSFGQFYPGDYYNQEFLSFLEHFQPAKSFENVEGCGRAPLNFIESGNNIGQWPWQGAIYRKNNHESIPFYACEVVLISSTHVLTPAHCVTYQRSEIGVPARQLLVSLGRNDLKKANENSQEFDVERVTVHPGYRASNLMNDLAVVKLKKAVILNDFVRPVCLNSLEEDGADGVLAGYKLEEGELGGTEVTALNEEECLQRNSKLRNLLTDNVVCAVFTQDVSACVGNSGSSLVSLRQGQNTVFDLKGIVTVGIALQGKAVCDGSSVVLLEDVSNYLKFIESAM